MSKVDLCQVLLICQVQCCVPTLIFGGIGTPYFIAIARGLEILTICLKFELLHEQGTGSVTTKGAQIYQQGPYRADYSNGKVGKVKDLQASLLPSLGKF